MHCWPSIGCMPDSVLVGYAALQVFGPDTTQERLYGTAVSSIVTEVLEGFNCTIFACECSGGGPVDKAQPCVAGWHIAGCRGMLHSPVVPKRGPRCAGAADGQTGTGKTHTMTGDIADDLTAGAGVIPRAIHQIFSHLEGEAAHCLAALSARPVWRAASGCRCHSRAAERQAGAALVRRLCTCLPIHYCLTILSCRFLPQALPASTASSAPTWSCTTRRSPTCWRWGMRCPR